MSTTTAIPQINAYTQTAEDTQILPGHFHVSHEMILIEEGEASFHIQDKSYVAKPHSLVIIGNLEKHDMSILSRPYVRHVLLIPNEFCLQAIREPALASVFLYRPDSFSHVYELDPSGFAAAREYFASLIEECRTHPPLWELRCQLLLESLLLLLYRARPDAFHWEESHAVATAFQVQRYIGEHFREPLTLDGLSREFFVSRYYLSRLFKSVTGYGIQTYLQLCRINEAKRLLQFTDLSVNDICFSVGYKDVNHFIRLFHRQEGTTPLQFRKNP
jgi:AraC-like DNA-binding protein